MPLLSDFLRCWDRILTERSPRNYCQAAHRAYVNIYSSSQEHGRTVLSSRKDSKSPSTAPGELEDRYSQPTMGVNIVNGDAVTPGNCSHACLLYLAGMIAPAALSANSYRELFWSARSNFYWIVPAQPNALATQVSHLGYQPEHTPLLSLLYRAEYGRRTVADRAYISLTVLVPLILSGIESSAANGRLVIIIMVKLYIAARIFGEAIHESPNR
jgi:hypothetical protein